MTEHPGNVDVSIRVRQVRAELEEWEFKIPIDPVIVGRPQEEIMRLVMEEKWVIEERLKIVARNFPGVHEDARKMFDLSRRYATEPSTDSRLAMHRESDRIFHSYGRNDKIELKPLLIKALKDMTDYDAISWNPR